jgi:signal transduction histidine kinase
MATIEQKFHNEIEIERMWLASKQGEYIFFSILPLSTILVFVLWDSASHQLLLVWLFILTAINFFRWISLRFYHIHKSALIANIRQFKQILLTGSLFAGMWVGLGNVWFLDPSQPISILIISIFTIAVAVGAILSWFFYIPAVLAILLPLAGSLAVLLCLQNDKTSLALGLIFFLLLISGFVGSMKLGRMLNHALRLNFENVALRQESEEKSLLLETALENMGQGISMSGSDDGLRMWNRQFMELLGKAGAGVATNAKLSSLLNAADPPLQVCSEGATEYRLPNGQVYEIRQSELTQGGRVLTYTNISDLIKREQALEKARKEAVQANAAKTRFLAAASHDLRQPIHALGLFFAELSDRVYSPETALVIGQVEDSIAAINSMLNALLDVSKLDAGIVKPTIEPVALSELFARLQAEFQPIALENHNELRIRPALAIVNTDPTMLDRMLRNLIGNALRYTENGRILVAARRRGQNIVCHVLDTGSGIPEDQLDEIFVEFHQLQNPARDRRQGLGLGLAIVKRLSRLLHHDIKVTSQLGRGSCFSITLPFVHETADGASEPLTEKTSLINNSLAGCQVLVLDDDIAVLEGMRGLLTRWGCQVITAGSSTEAENKLAGAIVFQINNFQAV